MRMKKHLLAALALLFAFGTASAQPDWRLALPWHHPFEQPRPFEVADTVEVVVLGDVMMHSRQLEYPQEPFLAGIRDRLQAADLAVANLEFPLAGPPYTGYPAFSTPDSYATYIRDCGIDVFLTANNHVLDRGRAGLVRTLAVYDTLSRIRYTGCSTSARADSASYPLIVAVKGIRIALLNFTYGTNYAQDFTWPKINRMDKADIAAAIRRARDRGADFIVAFPHWGEEYQLRHNAGQADMARWLARSGVDAIVGSHPHVVQDYEVIELQNGRRVPVFYSLGNAVSNMSAINTRLELMVTLSFVKDGLGNITLMAPRADYLWCTLPGKLTGSYMTIPIEAWRDRRSDWLQPADYDNMMATLERVSAGAGIPENCVSLQRL